MRKGRRQRRGKERRVKERAKIERGDEKGKIVNRREKIGGCA